MNKQAIIRKIWRAVSLAAAAAAVICLAVFLVKRAEDAGSAALYRRLAAEAVQPAAPGRYPGTEGQESGQHPGAEEQTPETLSEQEAQAHRVSEDRETQQGGACPAADRPGAADFPTDKRAKENAEEGACPVETREAQDEECSPITVDFDVLNRQAAKGAITGWLYLADSEINFPVAYYPEDNYYYLDHLPDGSVNSNGTIYIDAACAGDFSGRHTLLYGHHRLAAHMFAELEAYRTEPGYYEKHPVMYINTPGQNYKLLIYSVFIADTQSLMFEKNFFSDTDFLKLIEFSQENSVIHPDVSVSVSDRIVTLVTCDYEKVNTRNVISGILVPIR